MSLLGIGVCRIRPRDAGNSLSRDLSMRYNNPQII